MTTAPRHALHPPRRVLERRTPGSVPARRTPGSMPARPSLQGALAHHRWMPLWQLLRDAALDALALVLPTECVSCASPDRALCSRCLPALDPQVTRLEVAGTGPPLTVWAAVPYDPVVSSALSALKERGRTDVVPLLARCLAAAVSAARRQLEPTLPSGTRLELTFAPSSAAAYRRRGYNPAQLLARRACALAPGGALDVGGALDGGGALAEGRTAAARLTCRPTLRVRRAVRDQAGLGVAARQQNLDGSLRSRGFFPADALAGRHFLVIDDVITTGATLRECRRALESAGATVWGAVALAHPARRSGASAVRVAQPGKATAEPADAVGV